MTLSERLADAEAKYHALMVGAAFVEVRDANGEMVRYKAANKADLAAYINDLKRQLGVGPTNRPMGVFG